MNLLFFHLEVNFGTDIKVVANNEMDLAEYLSSLGFTNLKFEDLDTEYGTCSLTDKENYKELAKCFYVKKI